MKVVTKRSLLIGAAVFASIVGQAQTADEIATKNIAALGGKEVIQNIKSLVIQSSVEVMGQSLSSTTTILNGKGYKSETEFGGAKLIQCINDKGGWTINPMMGANKATALPDDQIKASQQQKDIGGPLLDYAAKGNKLELQGTDGSDYKLKVYNANGLDAVYYVNKETYLIDRVVSKLSIQGQTFETTIGFSDYRKTDGGYMIAYAQTIDQPQMSLEIKHNKVTVNAAVDPSVFDMPK